MGINDAVSLVRWNLLTGQELSRSRRSIGYLKIYPRRQLEKFNELIPRAFLINFSRNTYDSFGKLCSSFFIRANNRTINRLLKAMFLHSKRFVYRLNRSVTLLDYVELAILAIVKL